MKRKKEQALYRKIELFYRNLIMSGELPVGAKLETEQEVQERFEVSRITARQAIVNLEKAGLVKRTRGRGTFVIPQEIVEEDLSHIRSFTLEMEMMGKTPGTAFRQLEVKPMSDEEADIFGLEDSTQEFNCLQRVRTADDAKVMYATSYFPLWIGMPKQVEDLPESIYDYLRAKPLRIEEKLNAVLAPSHVVKALMIDKNQPCMMRSRKSYDAQGRIFEYTICYYRGDKFTYTIQTEDE